MTLARGVVVRLYGLLFDVLLRVAARPRDLDTTLEILDGGGNERFV